jgi:hypothetical protein
MRKDVEAARLSGEIYLDAATGRLAIRWAQ